MHPARSTSVSVFEYIRAFLHMMPSYVRASLIMLSSFAVISVIIIPPCATVIDGKRTVYTGLAKFILDIAPRQCIIKV